MLPRLAMSMESLADQQNVHFRAIAPHRSVTGWQHDSSTVGCSSKQSGPACTFRREAEASSIHLVQAESTAVVGTLKTGGCIGCDCTWGIETIQVEQT